MYRATTTITPSRPTVVDYVFLLLGCSLSLYLVLLHPMPVQHPQNGAEPPRYLLDFILLLPAIMRLPEGLILMGPIFYLMQVGRRQTWSLTSLEWLWVFNGVGIALLLGWSLLHRAAALPEFLHPYATMPPKLWYLIFVPSMALLAAVLGILGMVRRVAAPWTHTFGMVLLLWPVPPLLGILSLGRFIKLL